MIRIWSEHLPLPELLRDSTLDLLTRHQVHPIVAVRPDCDPKTLADVLSAVRAHGLQPGIWPLLNQADGYWPSERNASVWADYAHAWLDELGARGARPDWLAVDLEPPLGQSTYLLRRTLDAPLVAARFALENMDRARYRAAERVFSQFASEARAANVRTLAVTLPLAAHDLGDDVPLWQDMFETPWASVPWDSTGIMAYGSIVAGASRGVFSDRDARALHQPLLERVGRAFGSGAHASLGVAGVGIFGDEPIWSHPDQLSLDVAAARAAGITDLAIFSLEGVLGRRRPEDWLRAATTNVATCPPQTWKSRAIRQIGGGIRRGLRGWFGR